MRRKTKKERKEGRKETSPISLELRDGLRKVDMNSTVVDEDIVHLEVGILTALLIFELNECVLKGVSRFLIPNDFTAGSKQVQQ